MIKDQYEYLCTLNKDNLRELGWDEGTAEYIRQQCCFHEDVFKP